MEDYKGTEDAMDAVEKAGTQGQTANQGEPDHLLEVILDEASCIVDIPPEALEGPGKSKYPSDLSPEELDLARRPLITDDAGVLDQVLTGGPDDHLAEAASAAPILLKHLGDAFLGGRDPQAPEPVIVGGVVEDAAVVDLQPGVLVALAADDDGIQAGALQEVTEGAAAVGGGEEPSLG